MKFFHKQIVAQFYYLGGCMSHLPKIEEALLCALVCQLQNLLPQHSRIIFSTWKGVGKNNLYLFLGFFLYLGLMGHVT